MSAALHESISAVCLTLSHRSFIPFLIIFHKDLSSSILRYKIAADFHKRHQLLRFSQSERYIHQFEKYNYKLCRFDGQEGTDLMFSFSMIKC